MTPKWPQNDPKMAKNSPKMAQKGTGVPQKIPKNPPKMAKKWPKKGPKEPHVIALKRVKMHCKWQKKVKKGQKWFKNDSKIGSEGGRVTTFMKSEHGNSLYFISSAVGFLYNNFPKQSIFSTQTFQKKSHFSICFFKKIAPQNPGLAHPAGG